MVKTRTNGKHLSKKEAAAIIVAAAVCIVAALLVCGVVFGGWLSAGSNGDATNVATTSGQNATSNSKNVAGPHNTSNDNVSEANASNESSGGVDSTAPSSTGTAATASTLSSPGASSDSPSGPSSDNGSSSGGSSSDSSSQGSSGTSQPAAITVTLTIDSSRAHAYNNAWPESMGSSTLTLDDGASVYDALCQMGATIKGSNTYVSSINGLGEFACGSSSGWIYQVNGATPNISCGRYALHGGENIVWIYTCDYKADGF